MSINIKELIKRHKLSKDPNSINWPELVQQITTEMIDKRLGNIIEEIKPEVAKAVEKIAKQLIEEKKVGPAGPRGPMGLRGQSITGPQGPRGKDGKSIRGPRGLNGKNGVGKDGKDGSPDKPLMIARKLNTLEGVIDQSVIKGLPLTLKNLFNALSSKKAVRPQAGGGVGNVVHESKSVSSATTSLTLNANVAASGHAIWAFYQGQYLVYGTHYTMSNKTMALLFTPQDDTFIDITYIRT
jgi:hypothetical protein